MLTPGGGPLASTWWQSVGRGDYSTSMLHAKTARRRLRRHGRRAQHPGRRPVAVRRHRDRQRRRWPRPTRSSPISTRWPRGPRPPRTRSTRDRRLLRQDPPGAFFTSGYVGSADDLTAGRDRRGPAARLRRARRRRRSSSRCCAPRRWRRWSRGAPSPATRPEQMALLGTAGTRMLAAKEGMLDLRAGVGSLQERVERAKAERVLRARHARPRAHRASSPTDPLEAASDLPDAPGAARIDLHGDRAAREPALQNLHALAR